MQETQVRSLGGEDPQKGMATHYSVLAWKIPWTEDLAGYSPWGHKAWDTTERVALSLILSQFSWQHHLTRVTLGPTTTSSGLAEGASGGPMPRS